MSNTYLGIDLGTSGVKVLLVDRRGEILASTSQDYPICYPQDGWSEQDPDLWLEAVDKCIDRIFATHDRLSVKGVSFAGQMHGLVALDESDRVIRPAILWNDGRTEEETAWLNNHIGKEALSSMTGNIAFAGFTAPKILWLKNNEPLNFAKIRKICLPKDYIAYKMTGVFSTDYSDASGMLLLDVENKCWSSKMCEICGVDMAWLPTLYESYEVIGRLKDSYAMPYAVVTAGAGDNAAAAIGTSTIANGECNISLGTSGTIFVSSDNFSVDKDNSLHSFAHASGKWHLMGCILSAASANKWWIEDILGSTYDIVGAYDRLGENNVYFLPYLMGERSPHNDVNARGAFVGMRPDTTRVDMSVAVLEGVAYALKDCLEVALSNGVTVTSTKICGGGAKSRLWREIIANVLGVEVCSLTTEQGPGYGACILAMVGAGEYDTVLEASEQIVKVSEVIKPTARLVEKYREKYAIYREIYPALKQVYSKISN
ncbi:MAG: xylulokinase [Clostridia bacterium]|nr:xylulokinase [Clostridia bacterium]